MGEGFVPHTSHHRFVHSKQRNSARSMRRIATDAERKIWLLLRDRRLDGIKFRRQVPFGPYILDFVCFERSLVVEIDGGQHAGSKSDQARDRHLKAKGFRVVRYWNTDVLQNPDGILTDLITQLGAQ
jgi:very-short-patch-repair endonuclease